jgi:hypothetical protein
VLWYHHPVHTRGRRLNFPIAVQVIGAVLGFFALLAWGLSSPVGATPDEDYHLVSMWCGQGDRDGVCEPGTGSTNREIPTALLDANCYVFHPEVSAACQGDSLASDDETSVSPRGNFTGDYPPVFFFVASFFVGHSVSTSVLAFRAANAALFIVLLGATAALSSAGLRRAAVLGAVTTAVPLSIFLIPSVNPSSWAVLSAVTLAVSALGYMTGPTRARRIALGAIAGFSLLIGAGARADSAIYAAIAVGGAGLIALTRTRDWRRYVYPVVLIVAAAASYLTSGQSGATEGGGRTTQSMTDFAHVLMDVPSLWAGALGSWSLGWFDTAMPPVVWFTAITLYAGVVFTALGRVGRVQAVVLLGVGATLVAVPAYIQYLSGVPVGSLVQPRYTLPLLVVLVTLALARVDGGAFRLSRVQWALLVAGLSVANAVALHTNIRRYVTGLDVLYLNLDVQREWWWGSAAVPSPMVVWAFGSIAFAAAVALVTYGFTRPAAATDAVRFRSARSSHAPARPADSPEVEDDGAGTGMAQRRPAHVAADGV